MSATVISMADFNAAAAQAQYVRRPVSVLVHWSESGAWGEEVTIPYVEFEAQAAAVATGYTLGGYLKTKITVNFDDGETYQCRIDLAATDEMGFTDHCLDMLRFYETDKGRDYYQRTNSEDLIEFVRGIDFGIDAQLNGERRAAGAAAEQAAREIAAIEAQAAQEKARKEAAEAYAAELARLQAGPAELAHLKPLAEGERGAVAAAKNVRRAFKKSFPDCKFSVTSRHGIIYITWQDGPTRAQVNQLVAKYKKGRFDSMSDCYDYDTTPFNEIYGGADCTNTSREISAEILATATRLVEQQSGEKITGEVKQQIWGEWADTVVWREAHNITLVDGVWHTEGGAIAWDPEDTAPTVEASTKAAAGADLDEPKFTATISGGLWSVTVTQGEDCQHFHGIKAATPQEAWQIAEAIMSQSHPANGHQDGGRSLPVALDSAGG